MRRFALTYLVVTVAASSAFADTLADCAQVRDAGLRLRACSEIIDGPSYGTADKALAYRNRGNARADAGANAQALPDFDYFTCVVEPESGHPKLGYVTNHLSGDDLHDGNVDVYVCGPPPMVEGVRKWMSGVGVTPRSFHFEKFSSANEAAVAA